MPQSRPRNEQPPDSGGEWEVRAMSLAVRLDHAADELRRLIDDYRESREEPRDRAEP
jgi:hypothetical protein